MADNYQYTSADAYMNDEDKRQTQINQMAWQTAHAKGDTAGEQRAHAMQEALRSKYGYSGGVAGNEVIKLAPRENYMNSNGNMNPTANMQSGLNNAGIPATPNGAGVSHVDMRKLGDLATAQTASGVYDARANYIKNLTNSANTYNQNAADLYNSGTNIYKKYFENVNSLYQNNYQNAVRANQMASNRGLTSSGLGNALNTSAAVSGMNQVSNLQSERDSDLASVQTKLDELSANYNINRDALLQTLYNESAKAKSDAYTNYMQNYMQGALSNAQFDNEYINNATSILGNYNTTMDADKLRSALQSQLTDKEGEWNYKIAELQGNNELARLKLMSELGMVNS